MKVQVQVMYKPKISIIAALSENRVIGKENKIPWHIKDDLIHLKKTIKGHAVILGRKTFESLLYYYAKSGRPLPGRVYIVITRDSTYQTNKDNCFVANSFEVAIAQAKKHEKEEIFIIGGEQIYRQAIRVANKLYLTIVHTTVEGDAFFPDYSSFKKKVFQEKRESDGYTYTFLELVKD